MDETSNMLRTNRSNSSKGSDRTGNNATISTLQQRGQFILEDNRSVSSERDPAFTNTISESTGRNLNEENIDLTNLARRILN
jgi:hypothetical protein